MKRILYFFLLLAFIKNDCVKSQLTELLKPKGIEVDENCIVKEENEFCAAFCTNKETGIRQRKWVSQIYIVCEDDVWKEDNIAEDSKLDINTKDFEEIKCEPLTLKKMAYCDFNQFNLFDREFVYLTGHTRLLESNQIYLQCRNSQEEETLKLVCYNRILTIDLTLARNEDLTSSNLRDECESKCRISELEKLVPTESFIILFDRQFYKDGESVAIRHISNGDEKEAECDEGVWEVDSKVFYEIHSLLSPESSVNQCKKDLLNKLENVKSLCTNTEKEIFHVGTEPCLIECINQNRFYAHCTVAGWALKNLCFVGLDCKLETKKMKIECKDEDQFKANCSASCIVKGNNKKAIYCAENVWHTKDNDRPLEFSTEWENCKDTMCDLAVLAEFPNLDFVNKENKKNLLMDEEMMLYCRANHKLVSSFVCNGSHLYVNDEYLKDQNKNTLEDVDEICPILYERFGDDLTDKALKIFGSALWAVLLIQ